MSPPVPLHCTICPKRPAFSDLSHLLTHIASKGHLSHYFRAQVRSRSESTIRDELELFDDWYDHYKIEKLLAQRMSIKDSKSSRSVKRRSETIEPQQGTSSRPSNRASTSQGTLTTVIKQENCLDPRLTQPQAGIINDDCEAAGDSELGDIFVTSHYRPYIPFMSSRPYPSIASGSLYRARPDTKARSRSRSKYLEDESADDDEEELSLRSRRIYPEPPDFKSLGSSRSDLRTPQDLDTSIDSHSPKIRRDEEGSDSAESKVAECAKLKGIIWPGMDLFDAATAAAKRKRNQKKDGTILQQMMATSAIVEPTEVSYEASGEIFKIRPITGYPNSSSPPRELSPKPKPKPKPKARVQTILKPPLRPILHNVTTNVLTRSARKAQLAKASRGKEDKASGISQASPTKAFSKKRRVQQRAVTPLHESEDDNEAEWRLNVGVVLPERKKKLKIYTDEATSFRADHVNVAERTIKTERLDQQPSQYPTFDQSYLSGSYHGLPFYNPTFAPVSQQFHYSVFGQDDSFPTHSHHAGPSSLQNTFDQFQRLNYDKENVEPNLTLRGRIEEPQSVLHSRFGNMYDYNRPNDERHSRYFGAVGPMHTFGNIPSMPMGVYGPTVSTMPTNTQNIQYPYLLQPPQQLHSHNASLRLQRNVSRVPEPTMTPKRMMTAPGGPGTEDGPSGDETVEEFVDDEDDLLDF
ncbi:hypothetical protein MMC25_001589 [Agyrium rufum]|nr:hypothetical protein [Agyrium rufum]